MSPLQPMWGIGWWQRRSKSLRNESHLKDFINFLKWLHFRFSYEPYFCFKSPTRLTYFDWAVGWSVPFKAAQASHLALPFKSNSPGRSVLTSPTVACLYKLYSFSNSSSDGLIFNSLTSSADLSKAVYERLIYVYTFHTLLLSGICFTLYCDQGLASVMFLLNLQDVNQMNNVYIWPNLQQLVVSMGFLLTWSSCFLIHTMMRRVRGMFVADSWKAVWFVFMLPSRSIDMQNGSHLLNVWSNIGKILHINNTK